MSLGNNFGGSVKAAPTNVASVSYWHIPNSTDYHNARVCEVFFDDMELAEAFEKRFINPPEMASIKVL